MTTIRHTCSYCGGWDEERPDSVVIQAQSGATDNWQQNVALARGARARYQARGAQGETGALGHPGITGPHQLAIHSEVTFSMHGEHRSICSRCMIAGLDLLFGAVGKNTPKPDVFLDQPVIEEGSRKLRFEE